MNADPSGLQSEFSDLCGISHFILADLQQGEGGDCSSNRDAFGQVGDWSQTWNLGGGIGLYMDLVEQNKEYYMAAAQERLAGLQTLMCSSVSANDGHCLGFPGNEYQDFANMTPNEFAARMVAVPMALNVAGWLSDWFNNKCTSGPLGLTYCTQQTTGIVAMSMPYSIPNFLLELQSAGYLELRYEEFMDIVRGNTQTSIGIAPIGQIGTGTFPDSFINCQESPYQCFQAYMVQLNPDRSISYYNDVLPKLTAARYLNFLVQYLDFRTDPAENPELFTSPHTSRSNSTAWALRCTSGKSGGVNICKDHGYAQPDGGAVDNFQASLRWARAIFGSQESDCLIHRSDLGGTQ